MIDVPPTKMKSGQGEKNENLVIGLDCSTTGTKAIAFNSKGTVEAYAHETIPLSSPKAQYYEQDPGNWWTSTQIALKTITRQINPERISALAVSNQRETFVPLGKCGSTGSFRSEKKKWSPLILKALELREDQLSRAYRPGSILGRVSREASSLTGLNTDTAIAAGGGDGQAAGSGGNAIIPGRAYLNLGTAVVAGIFGKRYRTSKSFRTMISCSENGYYCECSLRAGTFAIDWFIKKILAIDPVATAYCTCPTCAGRRIRIGT